MSHDGEQIYRPKGVDEKEERNDDEVVVASIAPSSADDDADAANEDHPSTELNAPSEDGVVLSVPSPTPPPPRPACDPPQPEWPASEWPASSASEWPTSDQVQVNGDHVTQVRVDAIVLKPETPTPSTPQGARREQEDREEGELWAHFGTPIRQPKNHITAVQVELNDAADAAKGGL